MEESMSVEQGLCISGWHERVPPGGHGLNGNRQGR